MVPGFSFFVSAANLTQTGRFSLKSAFPPASVCNGSTIQTDRNGRRQAADNGREKAGAINAPVFFFTYFLFASILKSNGIRACLLVHILSVRVKRLII